MMMFLNGHWQKTPFSPEGQACTNRAKAGFLTPWMLQELGISGKHFLLGKNCL
jgi:hypothetical protein